MQKAEASSEALLKAAADKIAAARQKEIAEGREAHQKAKEDAQLEKLEQYVQTFKANTFGASAMTAELNSMLGKLPIIRKILGNPGSINPILANHDTTTRELNSLIHDIKQCIDKGDYEGLKKIMEDSRFAKVKEAAHNHSLAIIEFKALPAEYTAKTMDDFWTVLENTAFTETTTSAATVAKNGLAECEVTSIDAHVILPIVIVPPVSAGLPGFQPLIVPPAAYLGLRPRLVCVAPLALS